MFAITGPRSFSSALSSAETEAVQVGCSSLLFLGPAPHQDDNNAHSWNMEYDS